MNCKIKMGGIFTALLGIVFCFFGCSPKSQTTPGENTTPVSESVSAEETVPKKTLSMEDIEWNVDQGILDGKRRVVLNYTNHSEYTLTNLEITFKEKSDITPEEKEKFYSDIQEYLEASDEDMEEIKKKPISMSVEAERIVNPGESLSNICCHYYHGSFYVMDMTHYQLVEPDIATIHYMDDNTIYKTYYDFTAKKFSPDDDTEEAYQWATSELGNKLPKPDAKIVEKQVDDTEMFAFEALGFSLKQFTAYEEQCKQMGYTVQAEGTDVTYMAKDAKGYEIYLWFDKEEYSMRCSIRIPENSSTGN